MNKNNDIQDTVLGELIKEKQKVTFFLVNGFQLHGIIQGYDHYVIILQSDGKMQMIYKHAISTITPKGDLTFIGQD